RAALRRYLALFAELAGIVDREDRDLVRVLQPDIKHARHRTSPRWRWRSDSLQCHLPRAKRSRHLALSLRGAKRRGNPHPGAHQEGDCRVASLLAMTIRRTPF